MVDSRDPLPSAVAFLEQQIDPYRPIGLTPVGADEEPAARSLDLHRWIDGHGKVPAREAVAESLDERSDGTAQASPAGIG
jgi:hypothetical protein